MQNAIKFRRWNWNALSNRLSMFCLLWFLLLQIPLNANPAIPPTCTSLLLYKHLTIRPSAMSSHPIASSQFNSQFNTKRKRDVVRNTNERTTEKSVKKATMYTHTQNPLESSIISKLGFFRQWIHINRGKLNREEGRAKSHIMVRISCWNGSCKFTVPYLFLINYALNLPSASIPAKIKC